MDSLGSWLYLIIGIAVLGVLVLVGLLAGRRGKAPSVPGPGTDVIAPPPTEADVETPTETPVEPTLEDVYFAAIAGRLQPAATTLQPA